jgi:hypothetical protein
MIPQESQRKASVFAADGVVTGNMVAQYAYCARGFHLAYVEGRWADNASTDEGRWLHRRVAALSLYPHGWLLCGERRGDRKRGHSARFL